MKKNQHEISLLYFSNSTGIQMYFIYCKLQARKFLISNSKKILNIKVVLSFFPIVFGISKTFYSKHQHQTLANIVEHTLPGVSSLSTKISWPTLEQIFLNQLQFNSALSLNPNTNQAYIKRIDFYNDSVVIQTNVNWHTKQKQIYMGAFYGLEQDEIQTRKQIGNNWYTTFSRTKKKNSFVNKSKQKKNWNVYSTHNENNNFTLYLNHNLNATTNKTNSILNLDELPLKLDWSSILKQFFPNTSFKNSTPITKVKFGKKQERIFSKEIQKNIFSSKLSFSVDNFSIASANSKNQSKIPQQKTLFFSQKMFNSKCKNSLLFHVKKSKSFSKKINFVCFPSFFESFCNKNQAFITKQGSISTSFYNKNFVFITKQGKKYQKTNKVCFPRFFESECTIPLKGIQTKNVEIETHLNPTKLDSKNGVETLNGIKSNFPTLNPSLNVSKIVGIKKKFLESKLKANFYDKNSLPFLNFSDLHFYTNVFKQKKLKSKINIVFHSIYSKKWFLSTNEIIALLQSIEEITIFHENHVVKPSGMSGYLAPDTSNDLNMSLIVKFLYNNTTLLVHRIWFHFLNPLWNPTLQITIPRNFSYSFHFLNQKASLPVFKFCPQSQAAHYSFSFSHGQEKTIYEGPSIARHRTPNELNGANQGQFKLNGANQGQFKQWMSQFFNSDTSVSDRREIFFGKNKYAEPHYYPKHLTNSNYSFNKKQKLHKIKGIQMGLLRKGRRRIFFNIPLNPLTVPYNAGGRMSHKKLSKPRPSTLYQEYPYVIYLNQKEWKAFFKKLYKKQTHLLPIAHVKFPKKNWHIWPLNQYNSKQKNFFTKKSFFLQDKNKHYLKEKNYLNFSGIPISCHYFPYSPTLLKENLPKKYFFGKAYKKQFSIYANKNIHKNKTNKFASVFYKPIEPISIDSWLFITQFSLGFFLLSFVQNISQKYGKEVTSSISRLLDGKSSNSNSDTTDTISSRNDDNFRLIKNIEKNFQNIAGIDSILPELSEIVWFLRNSGRSFKVGNTIPRRILLTGVPGTGKTLLVQAIAGEAEVPVLIESGSSLNQPGSSENGYERLKNIFHEARKIAPCIIFIDEIDSFGEARNQMVENPIINTEILDCISLQHTKLNENKFQVENFDFIPQSKFSMSAETENSVQQLDSQNKNFNNSSNNFDNKLSLFSQKMFNKYSSTQQKANLLMQFLIELDGIATEKKIIVFGATNRPQLLDAALTRPGRFNKTFHLHLPNKQKRVEILKLYSKNLGTKTNISWNYLANLTAGLSAADLAAVMNQSSMKAIEAETIHTIQTIEYGIHCITGYSTQKNQLKSFIKSKKNESITHQPLIAANQKEMVSKSIFIKRLSYYQAGKAVVHSLLEYHPQVISVHLWPEIKNTRYHLVNGIIEKEFSQIRTRIELESRIIGLYAGKAAEFLALAAVFSVEKNQNKKHTLFQQITKNTFSYSWQSDLGVQDMSFAGWLAQLMITKWYIYSKQLCIEKLHQFLNNSNVENIPDYEKMEFFDLLSYKIENESNHTIISSSLKLIQQGENSQTWIVQPWLQKQITKKLEFSYLKNTNWYKMYEGDHEENESTRCLAPDEYYHNNTYLKNLLNKKFQSTSSSLTWLDVFLSNRDDFYHSLILACFNKSIFILDENRELLDFFASYLIQKEIIREHEITKIIHNFKTKKTNINTKQNTISDSFLTHSNIKEKAQQSNTEPTMVSQKQNKNSKISVKNTKEMVQKNWSKWYKKKSFRFINFEDL